MTTSPVSFFATSLLGAGGMALAAQISSNDTSPKTHSSDHGIVPSAPPGEFSDIEDPGMDISNKEQKLLSTADVQSEREAYHINGGNDRLQNGNVVLEPETTGKVYFLCGKSTYMFFFSI